RDVRDVLDGYRGQGMSADRWWRLLQHDGQDVGCLILADYPPADQMELVYLGILPEFRGRGFGLAATWHALGMAAEGGRAHLTLAVDAQNGPAQALYRRAGFLRWDRKQVLLRFF
ncbi:MAG: GNAT family N-acetyltransferase, partial [Planctomycetales bacterium]|nr:GNAT family N-acetyltransferase [Planctomycetales bacterium]